MPRVVRHRSSGVERRRSRALARLLRPGARLPRLQAEIRHGRAGWSNGKTLFWIAAGRRAGQEAQAPQGRHRLSPLRVRACEPQAGGRARRVPRKHGLPVADPPEYNGDDNITRCSSPTPTACGSRAWCTRHGDHRFSGPITIAPDTSVTCHKCGHVATVTDAVQTGLAAGTVKKLSDHRVVQNKADRD